MSYLNPFCSSILCFVIVGLILSNIAGYAGVATAQTNERCWLPQPFFETEAGAVSIEVGDFDGDGDTDLVSANDDSNSVTVLLNCGDGVFQSHASYDVGTCPQDVAVGDLNGDGILDLAVANEFSENVSLLFGGGDGTFGPTANYDVTFTPHTVVLEDFDNDGDLDLFVMNFFSVEKMLNDGIGKFSDLQVVANFGETLSIADFNNDGNNDVAATDSGGGIIRFGNGKGDFIENVKIFLPNRTDLAATADYNGDGILDFACIENSSNSHCDVDIILGNGDGSFVKSGHFRLPRLAASLSAADLNGDSHIDLIVPGNFPNSFENSNVLISYGRGDGSFLPEVNIQVRAMATFATSADFNGDGNVDIALSSGKIGSSAISVLSNNNNQSFLSTAIYSVGEDLKSMQSKDLNNDGFPDLVCVDFDSNNAPILLSDGNGSYTQTTLETGEQPSFVRTEDLDSDGNIDIAIANSGDDSISIFLGNGNGTFEKQTPLLTPDDPTGFVVTDITGDSLLDIVFSDSDLSGSHNLLVYPGTGDGAFGPVQLIPLDRRFSNLELRDLNGDSVLDLIGGGFSSFYVALGNSDLTFRTSTEVEFEEFVSQFKISDINGDSFPDLAGVLIRSSRVLVHLGNGDGSFAEANFHQNVRDPYRLAVGDVSGDSIPDLVISGFDSELLVMHGSGDGNFGTAQRHYSPSHLKSILLDDFDSDGDLDVARFDTRRIHITPNLCISSTSDNLIGDINGDGEVDLLDIAPFVALVVSGEFQFEADVNGDGNVDLLDVQPFVDLLTG